MAASGSKSAVIANTVLQLARPRVGSPVLPFLAPSVFSRYASGKAKDATPKKKRNRTEFRRDDLKYADQFSLCDAMRYIRAFEVGRDPAISKYELAVSLKTVKNSPVIRNSIRLPHNIEKAQRVAVICPPDSAVAAQARKAGAALVGEDEIFSAVKEGRIEFERCLCHVDSVAKMGQSGIARILGPRQLYPNAKTGTIVRDVAASITDMSGATQYREKVGVVRLAIGSLGFTPQELQENIRAFMQACKRDVGRVNEKIHKEIHEVVLSSTNAPGFTLNGKFTGETIAVEELAVPAKGSF